MVETREQIYIQRYVTDAVAGRTATYDINHLHSINASVYSN
jgi:hypothetical protein